MEYVDLYLVHWPMAVKPSKPHFPMKREDIVPLDLAGVWRAMEECHRLGLAKMIGVSNFTTKKLKELLATAKIPPAVNQVRVDRLMNSHTWQQFLFHSRYDNQEKYYTCIVQNTCSSSISNYRKITAVVAQLLDKDNFRLFLALPLNNLLEGKMVTLSTTALKQVQ